MDGFIVDGELAKREYSDIVERLARSEAYFRAHVSEILQDPDWRAGVGNPEALLAQHMRSADLAVLGQVRSGGSSYRTIDPGAALLRLGRPVLVVPTGVSDMQAKHVVIGWKDTRECRRAVYDALPFLREAETVAVVEICSDEDVTQSKARLDDVVRYLTRHRLDARRETLSQTTGSEAEGLISYAHSHSADLIVTGAYGHSRLGEWIF